MECERHVFMIEKKDPACKSCFLSSDISCAITCACNNMITNFECALGKCIAGNRRLTSDDDNFYVVWSDPWNVLALILFMILACIAMWRIFRQCFECNIERVVIS